MSHPQLPLIFPRAYILLLTVACVSGCSVFQARHDDNATFTIVHWNDFHSQNVPYDVVAVDSATKKQARYKVGGYGNLAAYLTHLGRGNPAVAVLNVGDDFQGPPVSGITKGRSQIELLNAIRPDAATLGNHEFDYGTENLKEKMRLAAYPILAANVFDSSTGTTLAPPTLVKEFGRVKVGLIGLAPPDLPILTLQSTLIGMRMLDIDSVLTVHIRRLKEQERVNLIVLLSHMGVGQDTLVAMRRKDIDIIVGGHSHTSLFSPIKKNRTIIVQAGSRGRYIGKLDCVVDLEGDSVRSYAGRLIETKLGTYPVDSTVERMALGFEALVDKELNEEIGTLMVDWKTSFDSESNTGNWQTDVMRSYAGTDIALLNSGGLRKSMFAGPIKRRDIWEMNPFGNTFVTFAVTGEELLQILEWQAAGKGEMMQVSGLQYCYDPEKSDGEKIVRATVGGQHVEATRSYTVVTNNYVAGHAQELLGLQPKTTTDLHVVDKDVLIDYVQKQKRITSSVEGRITTVRSSATKEKSP